MSRRESSLPRRGYTLIEVLVATASGALLMSAVLAAFLLTGRLTSWIGTRQDVDSGPLLALNALAADLRASAWQTLTITTSPPALAFRMEDPGTPILNGFVPLNQFQIYYLDAKNQTLVRKQWTEVPAGSLTPDPFVTGRMTPDQVASAIAFPNGSEHTVAGSVVSMTCVPATYPTPAVVSGVDVTLMAVKAAWPGQTCQTTADTCVRPRNHP